MTVEEAHERAMRAYVRARIRDGWLPEGAARDACETWGVPVGVRAELIERLSTEATSPLPANEGGQA